MKYLAWADKKMGREVTKGLKIWEEHMDRCKEEAEKGFSGKMEQVEGIQDKEKDFEKMFVWIGDTGASSHMSHVWEGFTRVSEGQAKACFARDGDEAQARVSGDWKGRYHYTRKGNQYERGTMLMLEDVL